LRWFDEVREAINRAILDDELLSNPVGRVLGLVDVFLVHDALAVRQEMPLLEENLDDWSGGHVDRII
jgi:hypothetical protein